MVYFFLSTCCLLVLAHSYELSHTWKLLRTKLPNRYFQALSSTDLDPIVLESTTTNPFDRFGRALNFYSTAIPVFAAYKLLETSLGWKRSIAGTNLSEEEVEDLYQHLHEWGSEQITEKIKLLKGFYVKTGQIISTRVDIFPPQYTTKLSVMQDALDPIDGGIIKEIVRNEILNGAPLSEMFLEFDDKPLGSASIAQVHRAKLLDGRVVAVKVQRPGIESKLMGDITNLKQFSKIISAALPVDYYKIFTEMERTLKDEIDFLHEAQATNKIAAAVAHLPNNEPTKPPVLVPLPITGLVSRRVLVMEYIDGIALSKMPDEMKKRGVLIGSPESKLFGMKLLSALTDAYGYMIFGSGIIHGDPHPGNIFICPNGEVALLDCGQVKELTTEQRLELAEVVILVNQWEFVNANIETMKSSNANITALAYEVEVLEQLTSTIAHRVKSFDVKFKEGANDTCAAAVAILLFGNTNTKLPGGYAGEEISINSPIVQVSEFPQELVLLGRATVMIRGIANRLGINWGLSDRWTTIAMDALAATEPSERLPVWGVAKPTILSVSDQIKRTSRNNERIRFIHIVRESIQLLQLVKAYITSRIISLILQIIPQAILKTVFISFMTIKEKLHMRIPLLRKLFRIQSNRKDGKNNSNRNNDSSNRDVNSYRVPFLTRNQRSPSA